MRHKKQPNQIEIKTAVYEFSLGRLNSSCLNQKEDLLWKLTTVVSCVGNIITNKPVCRSYWSDTVVSKSNAKLKFLYQQTRNVNTETKKIIEMARYHISVL